MVFVFIVVTSICLIFFIQWYARRHKVIKYLEKFDGPPPLPIVGNGLELLTRKDLLSKILKLSEKYGTITKLWIGPTPSMLLIRDIKFLEFLLTSSSTLGKSFEYTYLNDWLGEGLLTNTKGDARWMKHRKILTPAFYHNVLEKFIPVFTSVCDILVKKLELEVGNPSFDVSTIMKLYTLDTICECAMGTAVNALENSDSGFANDLATVCDIFVKRTFNPLLKPAVLFKLSKHHRIQKASFKRLNDKVNDVILNKKSAMQKYAENTNLTNDVDEYGKKRRLAFLDLLLQEAAKDPSLTDEHIREEVGTFMFAGHDTTQIALSFCCYSMAQYQDIQNNAVKELQELFENDKERCITLHDLNQMKYIEAVIKETLRLYPPVPFYGRNTSEDLEYDGTIIPKGLTLLVNAMGLHRDPNLYPNPLQFDPDRFITGGAPKYVHAYLPFSAGPRDCIGKKFAMLEMKLTLATLLRKFEFLPAIPKHELHLDNEVVLISHTGICIQITKRNF